MMETKDKLRALSKKNFLKQSEENPGKNLQKSLKTLEEKLKESWKK